MQHPVSLVLTTEASASSKVTELKSKTRRRSGRGSWRGNRTEQVRSSRLSVEQHEADVGAVDAVSEGDEVELSTLPELDEEDEEARERRLDGEGSGTG